MKNSEILKAALKKIRKGWIKEEYSNSNRSKFCAVGAVNDAIDDQAFYLHSSRTAKKVCSLLVRAAKIKRYKRYPFSAVIHWNDAPKRTKAQVVNLFKKAIALALKEEAKSK